MAPPRPILPAEVDMPSQTATRSSSVNLRIADRAIALANAGISRHRSAGRSASKDIVVSSQESADTAQAASSPIVSNQGLQDMHDADNVMQEAAHTHKAEQLPSGCVMGTPVPLGRPVSRVCPAPGAMDLAIMKAIQSNNYKFVRHMVSLGWTPSSPFACSFSITLNLDGQQQTLKVREASPLHYALSCWSLEAAAALLIAFPQLASSPCMVESDSSSTPQVWRWTPLDMSMFLAHIYNSVDVGRHATYVRASLVVACFIEDASRLPFMQHGTPAARLAAAGNNPQEVTACLLQAAR